MGKKAVGIFMHLTLDLGICFFALFTMACYFIPFVHPKEYPLAPFFGLGLPVLLIMNLMTLGWLIWKRKWIWMIFPLLAIVANYQYITGMFQYSSPISPAGKTLKIMTQNIGGAGQNVRSIMKEVLYLTQEESVDILCFQEFNIVREQFDTDSLFREYPYQVISDRGNQKLCLSVLSKYPIIRWEMIPFDESINDGLWCDIVVDDQTIRVFNVHMQTTNLTQNHALVQYIKDNYLIGDTYAVEKLQNTMYENFVKREEQAQQVGALVKATTYPTVLCGDFNDTPVSYTYNTVKGERLQDGFKSRGHGYGYTFHGFNHLLRIDYILHSSDIEVFDYMSLPKSWSDHNPVLMEFALKGK